MEKEERQRPKPEAGSPLEGKSTLLTQKTLMRHFPVTLAAAFVPLAIGLCGCTYSMQRAQRIKKDRELAAMVYQATVNDRVRNACNAIYEATWTAVFHNPNSAASIVRQYCMNSPDCTSEVVRGGLMGVNVADDDDVQSIVSAAAVAQASSAQDFLTMAQRFLTIIDTAFSVVPYQGDAIKAGIEAAQAAIIDLKTGKPVKKPFIVFRDKPDLPWPARYHAPYYVYVNPEGKGVVGYAK